MSEQEKREEVRLPSGAILVKGAAPETGTELTSERMAENFRSLNQPWGEQDMREAVIDLLEELEPYYWHADDPELAAVNRLRRMVGMGEQPARGEK